MDAAAYRSLAVGGRARVAARDDWSVPRPGWRAVAFALHGCRRV